MTLKLAGGAALDAGPDMRQVAGEPEQLELEREHERVERGAAVGGRGLVDPMAPSQGFAEIERLAEFYGSDTTREFR